MTYQKRDIIHGVIYKNSEGYKYDIAVNISELELKPFDLFCEQVINTTDSNFDIMVTKEGDKIKVYIVDVDKTILI